MELSPLLSPRSVTVTRAGRVSTVTRNVPNMAPSLVAGVIVMLGGGDQSVTYQGAPGLGWTVLVMVCVMLPPMCVPAFRGGVEMDAASQTAQGLRTVTTEGCATPPWIHPCVWTVSRAGWAVRVRRCVNTATRSPPTVGCVSVTPATQVKAVTVCVTDTGTVYLVSVSVTWRGEGRCVRYRAVRVSTTTVPSTAPVTVPPRCAPVIQVGRDLTVTLRTVPGDVPGMDTVKDATEMSPSASVKMVGWVRTAPSHASTVRWMVPPVCVTPATRGQAVNWNVPETDAVSTTLVTASPQL